MKNGFLKLISLLLVMSFFGAGFSGVAFADSQQVTGDPIDEISYDFDVSLPPPYGDSSVEKEFLLKIDGKIAYCLDYGTRLSFKDGSAERQSQADYDGLNSAQKEMIQFAMHFGYSGNEFSGMSKNASYFVTQVLIWLIASEHFNTLDEESIIDVFFEKVADGKEKYNELKAKILNAKLYPSFNGQTVDLAYDPTANTYGATITDTNSVLQHYKLDGTTGLSASIDTANNTLTLKTSSSGVASLTMTRDFAPSAVVYWVDTVNQPAMQALVTADATATNKLQATVKVRSTAVEPITVQKTGELLSRFETADTDYGKVYKPVFEEKPLAGVVFQIIVQEDVTYTENGVVVTKPAGTVLCEMTTGSDGKATSSPIPMYVNYILREISTVNGFILIDDVPFYHKYTKFENFTLDIKNTRQKFNISFQKDMDLGTGKTAKPYNEVVFGVFTAENMTAGSVTIPAKSLMAIITPDSAGNAGYKDLPAGKYYLKELKAATGYIIDSKEYKFELLYDDSAGTVIEISINDGKPIENDIITGKGKVKKTDGSGKGLAGAVFHVYTEDGYFVAEVVSGQDGNTPEVELSYGKYYWIEIKAPEGCKLDKTKYYFEILNNGFVYETTVKNYYSNPKTGDENSVVLWVSLAFCSALVIWGTNKRRKLALKKKDI